MLISNVVLVLVNQEIGCIELKNTKYENYGRHKYLAYSQEQSMIIACANHTVARNIKGAIESLLIHDIYEGLGTLAYKSESLYKIKELVSVYEKHVKAISVKTLATFSSPVGTANDSVQRSLAFYQLCKEVMKQIDNMIEQGARLEKVRKSEVRSRVYEANLPLLDKIQLKWAYNDGDSIVIDYSGLIEWKALGVYPEHRRLIEVKYFL